MFEVGGGETILSFFSRTGPDGHIQAVDKLQKSVRLLQKVRAFQWFLLTAVSAADQYGALF